MLSTHSSVPITTGPIKKMFLQLTVKNQEHQKFKKSRCVVYFFEKEIEETIIPIDLFYCLFAVTHLSKETSNCQRTYIDKNLYNKNNGSHRRYRPCLTRVNSSVPTLASPMGIKSFNFQRINLCLYYILFSIFINIFFQWSTRSGLNRQHPALVPESRLELEFQNSVLH